MRFGERQEFVGLLESRASLAAEVLGDPQSVQYREVKDRARSPGFCYEAAGMPEDFGNLGMHVALRLHQRHGQSDLEIELLSLPFARVRQIGEEPQRSPQLRFRLEHCRAGRGLLTGFGPVDHCLFDRSGLGVVMREQRGLLIRYFGEALVQHRCNAGVKLTPFSME